MSDDTDRINEIVSILLKNECVNLQDIRSNFPDIEEVKIELMIHQAREIVRLDHHIDFAPIPRMGGWIHRASPKQIEERSIRGRKAGIKKLGRAVERMGLAAKKVESPEERARLERTASHQATQLLAAKVRQRRVID